MREILFRGKRTANGEWVYGYLVKHDEKYYIYYEKPDEMCQTGNWLCNKEVVPETVGQYTGLKDKNGKKIFEGDIVKSKKYGKTIGHSIVNDFDVFVVIYEPAMFRLENTHRAFNLVGKVGKGIDYEIIGNIHDNPELMKGGAD